ncbi:MAG: hypothetical protein HC876_07460, partial [Chloroflexaceae bacterium]|nr:hypothetical protein [Chloroflexaceae bacterium]
MTALEWIEQNTAPTSQFLINTTGWFSHVDRGTDGGWWITPLTGRSTSLPPACIPMPTLPMLRQPMPGAVPLPNI